MVRVQGTVAVGTLPVAAAAPALTLPLNQHQPTDTDTEISGFSNQNFVNFCTQNYFNHLASHVKSNFSDFWLIDLRIGNL